MRIDSFILLFLTAALAYGQKVAACHKGHSSPEYTMTPMLGPPLRAGIGTSALKITTKSGDAQKYFTQGLALLHCFWDFEAYRAFKEAARLDPAAPMAYWGIAQSIGAYKGMEDEKKAALEKAKALIENASDQEQYYLRALQAEPASEDYVSEMETLIGEYPEDSDAKVFFALSRGGGYDDDDRPKPGTMYGLTLLRNVLAEQPNHPAANHYLIHLLEGGPHAAEALDAADRLGKLAPASGHMVHMPGHIYYKLGDHQRAREAFRTSMDVDEAYMRSENVAPRDDWNYAHNLSYLIASDAEAGRYREALEMAAKLEKLPANPFLANGKPTHAMTVGSSTIRLHLRFGNWKAVIDHPLDVGNVGSAGPGALAFRDGVAAYASGMQAVEDRHFEEASRQADVLDAIQWRLKTENEKPGDKIFPLLTTASLDLRGNLKCAQGDTAGGFELLKKSGEKEVEIGYGEPPQYRRPQWESLGYAYLRAGKFDDAREAFEEELEQRPKSGHALYGIALTFEKAGKKAEAAQANAKFLEAWKNADPDLAPMQRAKNP